MEFGINRLTKDLRAIGLTVEGPFSSGGLTWLIVAAYTIIGGRFAGHVVRIAVPVPPDYPQTPPGGLYVSPNIAPASEMGGLSIHDRSNETGQLPGVWQYWSRPIPPGTWKPSDGARRLRTHWNAVFMNV